MDGDGIRDGVELRWSPATDPFTTHRLESADTDGDGLSDYEEGAFYGSNPNSVDSDRDGLLDFFEVKAGLNPATGYSFARRYTGWNGQEVIEQGAFDFEGDLDGDGLGNGEEQQRGWDPIVGDSDGDGLGDVDDLLPGPGDGCNSDEVCWVALTIGGHGPNGCGSGPGGSGGNGPSDAWRNDDTRGWDDSKRINHWIVSVTDGATGTTFVVTTGPNGERTRAIIPLTRGTCHEISMDFGGFVRDSGYYTYFLGLAPVDRCADPSNPDPAPCPDCCCVQLASNDSPDQPSGTLLGNHCYFNPAGRTARVCVAKVDVNAHADDQGSSENSELGRVIALNDSDSDNDGIPGFADGFNLNGDADSADDGDDVSADDVFVRIDFDAGPVPDLSTAMVNIRYDASDPALVTSIDGEYEAAPGLLRLWRKHASAKRDKRPSGQALLEGGDFVAPGTYPLSALATPGASSFSLYAEATHASTEAGAAAITFTVVGVCTDTAPVSTIQTRIVIVRDNGDGTHTAVPVAALPVSMPTPVIHLNFADIGNLRLSGDKKKIIGDITVSGIIDDAASDLIQGPDGIINSMAVWLNGEKAVLPGLVEQVMVPIESISKNSSDSSILHPHDFSGQFFHVIEGIEVQPGWNQVRLTANNHFGFTGFAEQGTVVAVIPPPTETYDIDIDVQQGDPYSSTRTEPIVIHVRHTSAGIVIFEETLTLQPTTFKPGQYALNFGTPSAVIVKFEDEDAQGLHRIVLTHPGIGFTTQSIIFERSAPNANIFTGGRTDDFSERTDYAGSTPITGSVSQVRASDGEAFAPFLIECVGPPALLDPRSRAVINGQEFQFASLLVGGDAEPRFFLSSLPTANGFDLEVPTAFIAVPKQTINSAPLLRDIAGPSGRDGLAWFVLGFGRGVWDGTGGSIVDLYDGAVSITTTLIERSNLGIAYRMWYVGDIQVVIDDELTKRQAMLDKAVGLAQFVWQLNLRVDEFVLAALLGDHEHVNDEVNQALQVFEVVWSAMGDSLDQMDDYDGGRLSGRIMGEIIGIVAVPAAGALTTSAKVTQLLAKLRTAEKFRDMRDELQRVGQIDEVLGAAGQAGRIERAAADIATTRMCFVAGTLVITATGPIPIECIEVGDWVWSRDEQSGHEAYREVVDTIVTRPQELMRITVGYGDGGVEIMTGTSEHPFFVLDQSKFVPMSELQPGDALLRSGSAAAAYVTNVQVMRGPPDGSGHAHGWDGRVFTTYNLEIADFHTYFVGSGTGVWVHNTGTPCQQIKAMFVRLKEREGLTGIPALQRFLERTDTPARKALVDPHLRDVVHQTMNDYYLIDARLPGGAIDPSRVQTYAQMKALADANPRIGAALIEVHHTVPEYLLEMLIENRHPGATVEFESTFTTNFAHRCRAT